MPPPPPNFGAVGRGPGQKKTTVWGWVLAVGVVVVVALVLGGLTLIGTKADDTADSAATRDENRGAVDEWDIRIKGLVAFVEAERGHQFKHPVKVNFLTAAQYTKASQGDDGDVEDKAGEIGFADGVAEMRALGLISGELDLKSASQTLIDDGSLAFYSTETKEVYVRGTELDVGVQVTMVHELTHVLQDQIFDLENLDEKAPSMRAMAEGDATRIENRFLEGQSEEAQDEIFSNAQSEMEDASSKLDAAVPDALQAVFQAPYAFGPQLVESVAATGGNDLVDRLFLKPPGQYALFNLPNVNPFDQPFEPGQIVVPLVPDGSKLIGSGPLEPWTIYLMLSATMRPAEAMKAADTVKASGYQTYKQDGRVCVAIRTIQGEPAETELLDSAVKTWSQGSSGRQVKIAATPHSGQLSMTTCDPGAAAPLPGPINADVLVLPAARSQIYVEALDAGRSSTEARCLANGVAATATVEQLTTGDPTSVIQAVAASCW